MGSFLWGILGEVLLCLFFRQRLLYHSLGLWIGIGMAMAAAYHMWWALDLALEPGMPAQKVIAKHSMLRYGGIVLVFAAIMLTDVMNPLTAFYGIMGLKAAAYLQPFIHKHSSKGGESNKEQDSERKEKEVNL